MESNHYTDTLVNTEREAGWLVTYADLMTLLLVFFVLLYTLAFFENNMYKSAVELVKTQLDQDADLTGLMELLEIPESADTKISIEDVTGLHSRDEKIKKQIVKFTAQSEEAQDISTKILDNKIIVSVKGRAIFDSGSVSLKTTSLYIFDEIIQILHEYPEYNINIKGHTDNIPISKGIFKSNWELSAIRATTVLQYLIEKGVDPQRLTATGYGDSIPLVENNSEENRAVNRRVEFVLEKKETP